MPLDERRLVLVRLAVGAERAFGIDALVHVRAGRCSLDELGSRTTSSDTHCRRTQAARGAARPALWQGLAASST
jgi:hypothetical protein